MGESIKRKIGDAMPEEQSSLPEKSTAVRPFCQGAQTRLLLGSGSSLQTWPPSGKGLASAGASSSGTKPCLQLGNFTNSLAQGDRSMSTANLNVDHDCEKMNHNGGVAISGVDDDGGNTPQTNEAQAEQHNKQLEIDPEKLKRIMANRASAQKSRMRKNEYIADLEGKVKSYQNKIALLHSQVAAYRNHQRLMLIEQHKLKYQMVAREKERILKEVEIAKNREDVNRLNELRRKQMVEAHAILGAAQNGVGTSRREVDSAKQLQNQSQIRSNLDMGQRSSLNLNIVQSKPREQ